MTKMVKEKCAGLLVWDDGIEIPSNGEMKRCNMWDGGEGFPELHLNDGLAACLLSTRHAELSDMTELFSKVLPNHQLIILDHNKHN